MSSIHKHGNKYVYHTRVNGKQITEMIDVRTIRQARMIQDELDIKYARKKLGLRHIEKISIDKFLDEYNEELSISKKDSWYKRLYSMWKNFRDFLHEQEILSLEEIDGKLIRKYKKYRMHSETYRHKKPSDKTINEELAFINNCMKYAVEEDYLETFDVDVQKIKIDKPQEIPFTPFSDTQIDDIFKSGIKYLDYFKTLYYTGMRAIDVGTLKSSQVVKKDELFYIEKETKKKGIYVAIPIHREIMHIFRNIDKEYIFPDLNSEMKLKNPYRVLKRFVKNQNWQGYFSVHSFRHSFNQRLLTMNIEQSTRALLMGHDSIKSNKKYTHADIQYFHKIIQNF